MRVNGRRHTLLVRRDHGVRHKNGMTTGYAVTPHVAHNSERPQFRDRRAQNTAWRLLATGSRGLCHVTTAS